MHVVGYTRKQDLFIGSKMVGNDCKNEINKTKNYGQILFHNEF